eukprot:5328924-Prymnesium_polylepis.1
MLACTEQRAHCSARRRAKRETGESSHDGGRVAPSLACVSESRCEGAAALCRVWVSRERAVSRGRAFLSRGKGGVTRQLSHHSR